MKQGLYANINAKQARIKAGSGERCVRLVAKVRQLLKHLDSRLKLQRNQKR
jgi:hypothetical protein